jgi:hypothetical protein
MIGPPAPFPSRYGATFPGGPLYLCRCGRRANGHGKTCCQMCWIGYGTHSRLCRERNEKGTTT